MKMRLDRWLATLGVCSRSEGKDWIRRGAILVNGLPAKDPAAPVETEADRLTVRGEDVDGRICRHVMLHKPAGLLTAARDRKQPTVMDLLPPVYGGIGCMPVGRLDKDTTGLLLLTCDGELNHRLLSPGRHVDKIYRALVQGRADDATAEKFAAGMDLGDFTAQPAKLTVLRAGEDTSLAEVTVAEGKFHQVKRMFAAAGHEVLELHRRAFGPLELDPELAEGQWRELTEAELSALRKAAGMAE
jgi:16S rRNA pseudouridine516 synthase